MGSLEEAGHIWGELFLVTGSLSQAPGARVTGRELFAFPLAPGLPPAMAQGGQGHSLPCCVNFSLSGGLQPSCLSDAPAPLKGHQGHCFLYPLLDVTQSLAAGPPSGLLAVTGGGNNPSNPVICTGLFSRPSPSMCTLS